MELTIGYLYPEQMNIYGDFGNITTLTKRLEWRGIKVKVKNINIGTKLRKGEADIYFFGGGQDQNQMEVSKDIFRKEISVILIQDIDRGVPCLSICGGYQLLGQYYKPHNGPKIKGLGILPAYTQASNKRMIGNLVISSEFGDLVGFENHSGQTFLENGGEPLGKVLKGFGNNGEDGTEGCIYKNAIGCYLHGSLLPKNPKLADWLIKKALEIKYGKEVELKALNDELENQAHEIAISKFG